MKKIIFKTVYVLCIFTLVSCEDNDTTQIDQIQNPLIGKWNISQVGHIENIGEENFVIYEDYVNECGNDNILFTAESFELNTFYTENDNCTSDQINGSYSYGVNNISLQYEQVVNNETIVVEQPLTIIQLTSNMMEVAQPNETTGETDFTILIKE
ncbi:lipocalin family protein [Flavobacterium chuncheonense]|uniref:Lipocalin family protein n=1 Tax=Flavobacterium chuncheonense TaxID=2026653 RepID=A0ABW5YM85_9FLAO